MAATTPIDAKAVHIGQHLHHTESCFVPKTKTTSIHGGDRILEPVMKVVKSNPLHGILPLRGFSAQHSPGTPASSFVRKLEPQPHVAIAFGLLIVKPPPIADSL